MILWISGPAGLGKSSIAHSIAQYFDTNNSLGSSFFFDRAHQGTRHANNLFSTIAQDLAGKDPVRKSYLAELKETNPSVLTSTSALKQFIELIVKPEYSKDHGTQPVIIIIDALDECADIQKREPILSILSDPDIINQLPPHYRIVITSRPDDDIYTALSDKDHIATRNMQRIDLASVESDIRTMLIKKLGNLRNLTLREPRWCEILIDKSEGLFQWAATGCYYIIGDGKAGNPLDRWRFITSSGSGLY